MRAVRAIWRFVTAVVGGTWRFLRGIFSRFVTLVEGIFEPPARAFLRLLEAVGARLDDWLGRFLAAWARIFQKAPRAPRDRRPTPGRAILPLAATVPTLLWWYVVPWQGWFDLASDDFPLAVYATAVGVALLLRSVVRTALDGKAGSFLVSAARRTGLIWLERLGLVTSLVGLVYVWGDTILRPAALLVAFGFLVVNMSPYEPRRLPDDLPVVDPLTVSEPVGSTSLHAFRWELRWAGGADALDITVVVDADSYEHARSVNPGRPADLRQPDFTPWVVDGATVEVDRAAAEIRRISNERSDRRFQEAAAVLGFAQSVEYSLDEESTGEVEYWRFPVETVHDETGDCEDTTILAAAVLRRLGHAVLPLLAPGHAALGVRAPVDLPGTFVEHDGVQYYYCETTAEGFRIGELPDGLTPDDLRPAPLREDR